MKNKARGNEAEMANIARGEARARQCFNCYREFPLQIRVPL